MSDVPVVPGRSDPPSIDIYSRSKAHEISGKDPSFEYQYFSTDPKHPTSYVGNRLRRHEIGDQSVGYTMVDPWEVVHDNEVQQGKKRADDGKGTDTTVRHADLILCRTPKANAGRYQAINDLRADRSQKMLASGERRGDKFASTKARVRVGYAEDGAHDAGVHDTLNGA